MSLMLALTGAGVLAIFARLTFLPYFSTWDIAQSWMSRDALAQSYNPVVIDADSTRYPPSRASLIADSVATTVRRETNSDMQSRVTISSNQIGTGASHNQDGRQIANTDILGTKYRRDYRPSKANIRRDQKL